MRRLIVNADDFGLTSGVNRGILECHERGIVTSTTLMACGKAFDEAARMAQASPHLSAGCHVVLVNGQPLLAGRDIPSLVAEGGTAPNFLSKLSRFATASLTGRLVTSHIEAEATAQIRKLQLAGIAVSHIDSHKHTHMFPQALEPLLKAAKACGVPAIRNPFEPAPLSALAREIGMWKRWTQVRTLRALAPRFREAVDKSGLATPDGTVGVIATGSLTAKSLQVLLENLPEGTWELVCHPGYDGTELMQTGTRLRASREQEVRLLTAPETRRLLESAGIQLISYREFVQAGATPGCSGTSGQAGQPA